MIENIGHKIKIASVILAAFNSALSFVYGFSNMRVFRSGLNFILFLLAAIAASIVLSLVLYGFGELVENSSKTETTKTAEEELSKAELLVREERKREEREAREEARRLAELNLAAGREADADPYLTDEEIVSDLGFDSTGKRPGTWTCPVCGTEVSEGFFCPHCGTRMPDLE